MRFDSWDALKKEAPFYAGAWDQDKLKEYLIQFCDTRFRLRIQLYFAQYRNDGALADLLFAFLLNDDYDGSDCQIGAAYFISKLDRNVLKERKAWLLKAQESEVFWRRPFQADEYLEWI
jgi:hypothetical protein